MTYPLIQDLNDMAYKASDEMVYSLKKITDGTVTIPPIQRGLVWKPKQVELLWDSILRRFPIGSFLLSDATEGKYDLMDGQQRFNAISLGFNDPDTNPTAVLWIDIDPPKDKDSTSTRTYWIKATTKAHPWGFKNDDNCTGFNTQERNAALKKFGKQGLNIYKESVSLKETWPVESGCPIPLYCLIKAAAESKEADSFFIKTCELFKESGFTYYDKASSQLDGYGTYVKEKLYPAFSALKKYRINCNHLPKEVVETETNDNNVGQSPLEVLFTRLTTGGTQISRDDLNYSAIKAYWPSIKEENDNLAKKYMSPSKLVMLAFRLALTVHEGKELKNELSIRQIRNCAKDPVVKEKIEKLYLEGTLKKILQKIDDWLGVSDDPKSSTPRILRTSIARKSPDVYLLLMYFAYKDLQEDGIALKPEEIRALAFGLHWFCIKDRQQKCVQGIFSRCKDGIKKENIQKGIARMMHDGNLMHIYSFDEVKDPIEIKGTEDWRVWNSVPEPAKVFFDRIFWYGSAEAKEMLLFAEREYFNSNFRLYDPAREDLWADYNRPWDYDHIIAQDRIENKRGSFREYDKVWLNCIGNIAAISYTANRRKNNRADYTEYQNNSATLLYNNRVEEFDEDITYNPGHSESFAHVTYDRFCTIYSKTYDLIKPLFGSTILSNTLQERKDIMTAIADHYQKIAEHDHLKVIKHFAAGDDDYPLEREQDWAREWVGVGVVKNGFMACFEWNATENMDGIEIGIRKSLHTKVTMDNKKLLTKLPEYPMEYWWYYKEPCAYDKIDFNHLIERLKYYLSMIPD
ncbi:MAG: DUF262 domain-containing protein [Prevotella sp.]|nr:DUF262 domain-containing protein [Prevotella sp.]